MAERDPQEKTVVVTGGAMGIGYQIAAHFLKYGAKVIIILDINETVGAEAARKLNDTYREGKAVFMKCDVTKDLDTVSSEILLNYKVDILVNNAGILDESSIRKTLEINVVSVVEWSMKFWDYMRKDNGGSGGTIVNLSSVYGFEFDPFSPFYKTSKHAVIRFTKTLGHPSNYEKSGVRVFAVCPGLTGTSISKTAIFGDYNRDALNKFFREEIIQKVETVGEAVIEMFRIADSGTGWVIKDEKPIEPAPINAF